MDNPLKRYVASQRRRVQAVNLQKRRDLSCVL